MKKAIIIPSYNAAKTLSKVILRIPPAFWENGIVVIVNDCSPDDTGIVSDRLAEEWPGILVEHHTENRGYGGAQKTGLTRALAEGAGCFAVVHADGQYAPEVVLDLMKPILEGKAHIVQGSRMLDGGAREGGMPFHRYWANRLLTSMENLSFGTTLAEFHSGYMLYSGHLLRSIPYPQLMNNYNFDAEMIILAHLCGMPCQEIAIPTRYDDEISSLRPIPYGMNVLKMIGRYWRRHYHRLLREHSIKDLNEVKGAQF